MGGGDAAIETKLAAIESMKAQVVRRYRRALIGAV
jgi:hypothetical protein